MYSDRSELDLSDETIRIREEKISVESYDEKTAKNYRNCYVAEKCIVSKLSKILIIKLSQSNCNSKNRRLEWRWCQNFTFQSSILSEK